MCPSRSFPRPRGGAPLPRPAPPAAGRSPRGPSSPRAGVPVWPSSSIFARPCAVKTGSRGASYCGAARPRKRGRWR
eukprot:353440-Chlamydomonas_euryale.AAC.7